MRAHGEGSDLKASKEQPLQAAIESTTRRATNSVEGMAGDIVNMPASANLHLNRTHDEDVPDDEVAAVGFVKPRKLRLFMLDPPHGVRADDRPRRGIIGGRGPRTADRGRG